jgi:hypothetical protein
MLSSWSLWFEMFASKTVRARVALFLDRDGIVVWDTHYLGRAEDIRIIPPRPALANNAGYAVVDRSPGRRTRPACPESRLRSLR